MSYRIQGDSGEWEVVIGLEVHAQIVAASKLFSGAATEFGTAPNGQVSPVDAALPGMLPVINEHCVEQAVRTGLGLAAKINLHSVFERKNYFYADLPAGYQISQYLHPVVGEGIIVLDLPDGSTRSVGIERLHMEQDAGKSLHDQDPTRSYIDLNRAGIGLMEIVSKPDLRGPEDAGAYLRKLRSILRYLGTCDGNMEEGSMRCDVNVSVRPVGSTELRTRCEIKNVNSVRFVMQAIEHEASRQVQLYDDGGQVIQETRLYDPDRNETRPMRSKEMAHDYRYFPDPDLLPLELSEDYVARLRADLPELPDAKKARYIAALGLSPYEAEVLVAEKESADFFEKLVALGVPPKTAANWMINNVFGALKKSGTSIAQSPVSPEQVAELIKLESDQIISRHSANTVIQMMYATGGSPLEIVEKHNLTQITDTREIEAAVAAIVDQNPDKVADIRAGKDKLLGWFVGQVMRQTQGKANPQMVNDLLRKKIGG